MNTSRYVVAGLARPRSPWFAELARWSNSGTLPIEFLKCMSAAQLIQRCAGSAHIAVAMIEEGTHGTDRDFFEALTTCGVPTLMVRTGPTTPREHSDRPALEWPFTPQQFRDLLELHGEPEPEIVESASEIVGIANQPRTPHGSLIAVCSTAGAGGSTMAMALAQGLASVGDTGLIDGCGPGSLALYHDQSATAHHFVDLIEAFRFGDLEPAAARELCTPVPSRGYELLTGMRRARDWTSLRTQAVSAAISTLRDAFEYTVIDVEPWVDGEAETGSLDMEERNSINRQALGTCDVAMFISRGDLVSIHQLVTSLREAIEHGVDPDSILIGINHAPRSPLKRSGIVSAIRDLMSTSMPGRSPIFIPTLNLENLHLRVDRLPAAIVAGPTNAVRSMIAIPMHRLAS